MEKCEEHDETIVLYNEWREDEERGCPLCEELDRSAKLKTTLNAFRKRVKTASHAANNATAEK